MIVKIKFSTCRDLGVYPSDALQELALRVGQEAYAVIKASDVMVGKDK